jgi:hypothetical protein
LYTPPQWAGDSCEDIPFDVVQRLGLSFTTPEHEEGLRCHYDAGNYQLAVEAITWREYAQSLPDDAIETTVNGHRAVLGPQAHLPQQLLVHLLHGGLQNQLRVIQQSLYYSTVYSSPEVDCPSTNLQRANELSPTIAFKVF